ncbi:MAG: pilus assembly protein PilM [Ruminococcus sp.]|nr:pilus assembly protein PilM [Ruminococcus sp.]MCD7800132.1 pilus assembly protein PilM [Ruminococcus sp.]
MLSFDITDRNVRIIKGTESNGKIKIQSAATLDLEEEVIVRGIPKDPAMLATQLNQVLKSNRMADKEAIVSVSSNHTIFKELTVPYTSKSSDFAKLVKDKMQESVSVVDDTYSISYSIVNKDENLKDSKDKSEDAPTEVTVLATACPHDMIDAYKVVFQFLSINLKSIVVASNCITKVLLADAKLKQKMPFLAVQIDDNFISMNLYQDNQLSFSRFASIDASDYTDDSDYILESIHENVFRMIQFQKNRSTEQIQHVVFYGDTSQRFRELSDDMEQMGLSSSVISVPPLINGYENLEFSNYANAIGAMFKRDKETEKINLLELGGAAGMVQDKIASDNSFKVIAGVSVGAVVAIFAVVGIALNIYNASIVSDIDKTNEFINSPDTVAQLAEYDNRVAMLENVRAYKQSAKLALDAYNSQPIIESELITTLEEAASATDSSISIENISYSGGDITISITAKGKSNEYAQTIPSTLIQAIIETGKFYDDVDYVGYNVTDKITESVVEDEDGNTTSSKSSDKTISFSITMHVKSDSDEIAIEYDNLVEESTEGESSVVEESVE